MRCIVLKDEEIEALKVLLKTSSNNTIRKRSQCLLLSYQKRTKIALLAVFGVSCRTIERWWFDSKVLKGVESLSVEFGRGVKTRQKIMRKMFLNKSSFTAEI